MTLDVLIIKMSSLGDVIHCLPAIADAAGSRDDICIDWVLEEGYQSIPENCQYVDRVIPIALRRWRGNLWKPSVWREMGGFRRQLRQKKYDIVIDAQGLIKSALVASLAKGPVFGLGRESAREPLSSLLYRTRIAVPRDMHAISRLRRLFSSALEYRLPDQSVKFGLGDSGTERVKRILLLHGTSWPSKQWPLIYWKRLAEIIVQAGYEPCVTWGDEVEKERCHQMMSQVPGICLLPRMELDEVMVRVASMAGVVCVDTGLGHLAAGLGLPVVALFGSTDPELTGVCGSNVSLLFDREMGCRPCRRKWCKYENHQDSSKIYPPCYEKITPEDVWRKLTQQIRG